MRRPSSKRVERARPDLRRPRLIILREGKKLEVGVYFGDLLMQQRQGVPTGSAWQLSQQQAAAALAGGMRQGFALAKA